MLTSTLRRVQFKVGIEALEGVGGVAVAAEFHRFRTTRKDLKGVLSVSQQEASIIISLERFYSNYRFFFCRAGWYKFFLILKTPRRSLYLIVFLMPVPNHQSKAPNKRAETKEG